VIAVAVRVEDGIDVGALIADTLIEIRMSHKEAALTCGVDQGNWTRGLQGLGPIDLWRVRLMPFRFWQVFIVKLTSALTVQWMHEVSADVKTMAVAKLRPSTERKEA
jgi:hypothetical protein